MPRKIVTRFVSTRKWWNPKTWGTGYTVWRSVWDMNSNLSPDEMEDFLSDQFDGNPWKRTDPLDNARRDPPSIAFERPLLPTRPPQ